ncbi:acyl-CoA N-acyltransferase [Aspergillus spinulosporus]
MSFTICSLLPSDYVEAFTVADLAFASLNTLLYNTYPLSPESTERLAAARLRDIETMPKANMFKAVDTETGKIIGVARWVVAKEEEIVDQSIEDTVSNDVMHRTVPETNEASTRGFYTMAARGKWEILGIKDERGQVVRLKRRVELETLFTHPEYQGNGVGSALLQWGLDEANRLGLMIYLEATEEGRPLYERFGFESVKVVEFDASAFGSVVKQQYTFMLRQPKIVRQ